MTLTADAPPTALPRPATPSGPPAARLTVYADLGGLSVLAHRRVLRLEAIGVTVDWRLVDPRRPAVDSPAVSGYAEAVLAGVGRRARDLLHEAWRTRLVDLDDPRQVRTLLADALRSGHSSSEPVRVWGYGVDVTGAPVTTPAWRLVRAWRDGWMHTRTTTTPTLVLDDGRVLSGAVAVERLGAEVARRATTGPVPSGVAATELALTAPVGPAGRAPAPVDLYWATAHGNHWMVSRRDALAPPLRYRLRPWV